MAFSYPVKLPRFTTEQYEQMKAEYHAKHGYTIYVPGFSDIVHLRPEQKPTQEAVDLYYKGDIKALGAEGWDRMTEMLAKRRRRMERFLASPTPTWMRNVASVMTFLDDTEDALTSAYVVGRIAARLAPRFFGRLFAGPIGWMMLVADIFNIAQAIVCMPFLTTAAKRGLHGMFRLNPFSAEAKARRARRMKRFLPGKGELIEILQTTDNMFGIGLCLGPILGLAYDIVFGTYRVIRGQEVKVSYDPPPLRLHEVSPKRSWRGLSVLWSGGQEFSDEDHFRTTITANLISQVDYAYNQEWNPLDAIEGLENMEICAPTADNWATRWVLNEYGIDPDGAVGWPHADKPCIRLEEFFDIYLNRITENFRGYCFRNKNNYYGWVTANNAVEFAKNTLALTEGEDQVEEDYTPPAKNIMKAAEENFTIKRYLFSVDCYAARVVMAPPEAYASWHYCREMQKKTDGVQWPPMWRPGDPLPEGVIQDPEVEIPPLWRPTMPLPDALSIDPDYLGRTREERIRQTMTWLADPELPRWTWDRILWYRDTGKMNLFCWGPDWMACFRAYGFAWPPNPADVHLVRYMAPPYHIFGAKIDVYCPTKCDLLNLDPETREEVKALHETYWDRPWWKVEEPTWIK